MADKETIENIREHSYFSNLVPAAKRAALDSAIQTLEQYCEDIGELSDGYHTFNQLYHQRAVLFACIVKQNKNRAWKSFKHSDGTYCFDKNGEWFIVGIDTPQGSYTYHYAKEYWDMFDCQELACGKEWDGHTEEDVTRLLSLEQQPIELHMNLAETSQDCISREEVINLINHSLCDLTSAWGKQISINTINSLPPVTPKIAPSEDCISRQAVIDFIIDNYGLKCSSLTNGIRDYLPSVTPQPKVGRWLEEVDDYGKIMRWHCDKCYEDSGFTTTCKWDYCPNCGAKMEVEE